MYATFGAMYGGSAVGGDTLSTLSRNIKVHTMIRKISITVVEMMRLPLGLYRKSHVGSICVGTEARANER